MKVEYESYPEMSNPNLSCFSNAPTYWHSLAFFLAGDTLIKTFMESHLPIFLSVSSSCSTPYVKTLYVSPASRIALTWTMYLALRMLFLMIFSLTLLSSLYVAATT